jgi:GNAT superfamily N-acetyltransferase
MRHIFLRNQATSSCEIEIERQQCSVPPWPRDISRLRRAVFPSWFSSTSPPLAREGCWIVRAVNASRTVGFALLVPDICEERVCVLEEIGVDNAYRNKRVGRFLIADGARWMTNLGFEHMHATPLHDEGIEARIHWFHAVGFSQGDFAWSAPSAWLGIADHAH